MTRREFADSLCGTAAWLFAVSQVACSNGAKSGGPDGGVVGMDAAGYDVDRDMLEDQAKARERLTGDEFIFDVQVHVQNEITAFEPKTPPEVALDFIKQIFVESDTAVACITGVPSARDLGPGNLQARTQLQEIIARFGGPRLVFHANTDPERAGEPDYIADLTSKFKVGAWKMYPHQNAQARLDTKEVFLSRLREVGPKVIAAHRGLSGGGGYEVPGSPVDVVRAAAKFRDIKFIIYHSGFEKNDDERQPYDAGNPDPIGVDRLVRALAETNTGGADNVYGELGTTWRNLMNDPLAAAHVMGKLLTRLGPDRVVWGTDCVFNGVPQLQIAAMRTFVIPEALQQQHGYPALTPELRRKIFGLNAAAVYAVDPAAVRYVIKNDDIATLKMALQDDPRSVPLPDRRQYLGPKTRREFLALLRSDNAHGPAAARARDV